MSAAIRPSDLCIGTIVNGGTGDALVAQLDRALDYESRGREFESSRARHFFKKM